MTMEWQHFFDNRILERGYAYANSGAVTDLTVTPKLISATVSGEHDYDVVITYQNDAIIDMYCDCPFANDGNPCKHMAAVLYCYDNDEGQLSMNDLDAYIDSLSMDELKVQLKNALTHQSDPELTPAVELMEQGDLSASDYIDQCFNQINRMIYDDQLSAFELSKQLIEHFGVNDLVTRIEPLWRTLIDHGDEAVKKAIYYYCMTHTDESFVMPLLAQFDDHYEEVLGLLLTHVVRTGDVNSVLSLLEMAGHHEDKETVERLSRFYFDEDKVRDYLCHYLIDHDTSQHTEDVIKECMAIDQGSYRYQKTLEYLKQYYLKTNQIERYRNTLYELMSDMSYSDHYFDELKSTYSPQVWPSVRSEVLNRLPRNDRTVSIFIDEGDTQGLLDYVIASPGLQEVRLYQNILAIDHTAELLDKYEHELNHYVANATQKKAYDALIKAMSPLLMLDGGKALAQRLIEEWRVKYSRRHLMNEALKHFIEG